MPSPARPLLLPVLGSLVLMAGPALAGRPLATEDAGVLGAGECEVESYLGRARERGAPSATQQSVQLGCGTPVDTQVALQLQRARQSGAAASAWNVVGKTSVVDGGDDDPSFALAWSFGQVRETGRWRWDPQTVNAVASWPLAPRLTLHGNLGWSHSSQARQSRTTWCVALEHASSDTLDVMAETFGDDRLRGGPWWQLGLRWAAIPERLWLDTSLGWHFGDGRERAATVGLRLAF